MAPEESVDALIDEGDNLLEAGEYKSALESFERALQADPEHWGAALGRIESLEMLWRTEEDDPERVDLEARILEATGEFEGADRLFARAHELAPREFPLPVRTTEADFRAILDKVLESLPEVIRSAVVEVPVLVEPKPSPAIAERAPHITPEVLGLFVGTTVGEKVMAPSGYPNVVLLYQRNLERAGRSRSEVSKEIKITLLHEYGHYLGFDEEELEHLGLG
jgi:predicted Zn-dependent protease with MMP-like domain/Arc/MetJ-type ribon-helix-helix transcriptional regulator